MNLRKEFFKILLGISYIFGIYFLLHWLKWGFWGSYLIIYVAYSGLILFGAWRQKRWPPKKSWIIRAVWLLCILLLFKYSYLWFGKKGVFIALILVAFFIIWQRRKKWLEVKWHIETMLFKKPLKDYIETGERPPKIKIRF